MRPYRPNNSTGARNVPTADQQTGDQSGRRRYIRANSSLLGNTRSGLDVASNGRTIRATSSLLGNTGSGLDVAINGRTLHMMPSSISEGFGRTADLLTRAESGRRSYIPATSPLLRNTRSILDVASNGRSLHMMPSSLFEGLGSSDNPSPTYGSSDPSATGEVGNTQCPLGCRCKRRANGELYGQTSATLPEIEGFSERYVRMRTNTPLVMGDAIQQSTAYPLVHPNLGASPWNFSIPGMQSNASPLNEASSYSIINIPNGIFGEGTSYIPVMQHNAPHLNGDSNSSTINIPNGIFGEGTSYIPGMQRNAPHLNGDSSSSAINLPNGIFGEGTSYIPGMPHNAPHLNGDSNFSTINLPDWIFGEGTSYIPATMPNTPLPLLMISSTSIQQHSPDFVELGSTSSPRDTASDLTLQVSNAISTNGDLDSLITAAGIQNDTIRSFLHDMAATNLQYHIRNTFMNQVYNEMERIHENGLADLEDVIRNTRLNSDGASSSRVNETRRLREDAILNLLKDVRYIAPPRESEDASSEVKLCCICQDEYVEGEDLVKLNCGRLPHRLPDNLAVGEECLSTLQRRSH